MPNLADVFLGSRKFTIMASLILIGLALRLLDLINGAELVSLYNGVGISFMGSNAVERITDAAKDWIANKVEDKE